MIIKNFAQKIHTLDKTLHSKDMIALEGNHRAYRIRGRDHQYWGHQIHVMITGENKSQLSCAQGKLSRLFNTNNIIAPKFYMGGAGFINLTYAAANKADAAVFYDINAYQGFFWRDIFKHLKTHSKQQDFADGFLDILSNTSKKLGKIKHTHKLKSTMHSRTKHIPVFRDHTIIKEKFKALSKRLYNVHAKDTELLFLHPKYEAYYSHLHEMAKANNLGALTLDVADAIAYAALKSCVNKTFDKKQITTFYISNIFTFLADNKFWVSGEYKNSHHRSETQIARENVLSFLNYSDDVLIDHHGLARERFEHNFDRCLI